LSFDDYRDPPADIIRPNLIAPRTACGGLTSFGWIGTFRA
jgi:hypothetical protein